MPIRSGPTKTEQLAEMIRQQIHDGELRAGERLPCFRELSRAYGVSQPVITGALDTLEEERLVLRRPRSGTYVRERRAARKSTGVIGLVTSFTESTVEGYWESICAEAARRHCLTVPIGIDDWVDGVALLDNRSPLGYFLDLGFRRKRLVRHLRGRRVCFVHRCAHEEDLDWADGVLTDFGAMYARSVGQLLEEHGRVIFVFTEHAPSQKKRLVSSLRKHGVVAGRNELACFGTAEFEQEWAGIEKEFTSCARMPGVTGISDYCVHEFLTRLRTRLPELPDIEAIGAYNTKWSKQPGSGFATYDMRFAEIWRRALTHMLEPGRAAEKVELITPEFVPA
jgi:DNA-binding transcriptional regulator YhcF (GntR family)